MNEPTREPWRGEVWRHRGGAIGVGDEYTVLARATAKSPDGPWRGLVVYRRLWGDDEHWVRPLDNFLERFVYVRAHEK